MLRVLFITLLLANIGYFIWASGVGSSWGFAPTHENEPERLQKQLNAEHLQISNPNGLKP